MIINNIDGRSKTKYPGYFMPFSNYYNGIPVKDMFIASRDYSDEKGSLKQERTGISDERKTLKSETINNPEENIKELLNDLNHEEKAVILDLVTKGKVTEKEVKSLVLEHKNFKQRESLPLIPYYITDLSEEGKKSLMEYIKANNLSKSDVKAMLKQDNDWRDIEQLVCEYFAKEREEAKDFCLNMWLEREKSTKSRLKAITAFYDEMNKTCAEIWTNKIKTNQNINEMIFKTFYG
jgi:hypothetical protein